MRQVLDERTQTDDKDGDDGGPELDQVRELERAVMVKAIRSEEVDKVRRGHVDVDVPGARSAGERALEKENEEDERTYLKLRRIAKRAPQARRLFCGASGVK